MEETIKFKHFAQKFCDINSKIERYRTEKSYPAWFHSLIFNIVQSSACCTNQTFEMVTKFNGHDLYAIADSTNF